MNIRLEKINSENWEDAIDLPVSEEHKKFVASNLYSIAQAQFFPGVDVYAIYDDDKMVGFSMFGDSEFTYEETGKSEMQFWVWRLMIADGEQYKGYGKKAMQLIIGMAKENGYKEMYLSTEPENENGIRFYENLGFVDTGKMLDDEEIFKLSLS